MNEMVKHEHDTYCVTWSEEDQAYVGLCAEFPSLSHLDTNHLAAMEGILNLVKDVKTNMQENGEAVPVPLSESKKRMDVYPWAAPTPEQKRMFDALPYERIHFV